MLKKKLPLISALDFPRGNNKIEETIFSRWNPNIRAAQEENNTITIYEIIGEDFWSGSGFTAKRMAAALRSIGNEKDVVVSINSPGGDFFEGAAIYNLLREHKGKVTVKIIGLAASAASLIAMAGETIQISEIGFYMIHDVWACVCGNRNELTKTAETFEVFDGAMADVYSARSGHDRDEIVEMMDNDAWMNATDAIEKGFADELLPEKIVDDGNKEKKEQALARRSVEAALARQGYTRKKREDLLTKAFAVRDAGKTAVRDAGTSDQDLKDLLKIIRS
jgi:ATP-dependent protease ClpP protease subunit